MATLTPEDHARLDAIDAAAEDFAPVDVTGHHYDATFGEYHAPTSCPGPGDCAQAGPDYPMTAVMDLLDSAIVTVRTVEDQLREHGRGLKPSADTAAFDALIKGAYLKAEDDAVAALAALQHAAQLVKGLAR